MRSAAMLPDESGQHGAGPHLAADDGPVGLPPQAVLADERDVAASWPIAGRYRLIELIGSGSMGRVWRAWDELLCRNVAIKEVRLPSALTPDEQDKLYERTIREAQSLAQLSHPAVATVHDVIEDRGRPWIVMELVDGSSLDRVIRRSGALAPKRAAQVGRELLGALTAAHRVGVLHRDVKPANVLLTPDGGAVLTDFGVAAIDGESEITQTGIVMGTPAFMAPERVRNNTATPAADLWSLGATLYAAVEGKGPYDQHGSGPATMAAILAEDPAPPQRAGPLAGAITALLSRDPARRPSAAAAMQMLEEAESAGATARRHHERTRLLRLPRLARRGKSTSSRMTVIAAAAFLVIAVPATIVTVRRAEGRTQAVQTRTSHHHVREDPSSSQRPWTIQLTPAPAGKPSPPPSQPPLPAAGGTVGVTSPGDQASTVGTAVSVQVRASDAPAGLTLAYQASGLPPGLSINRSTGLITGTPAPTAVGTSTVQLTVTDTAGASASATFTWEISATGTITDAQGCVDDTSSITTNGNKIQVWQCDQTNAQNCTLTADGMAQVFGECMTVNNGGTAAGSLIVLWDCTGTGAQIWRIEANGQLSNPASGLCLEDPNAGGWGTQLDLATCTGAADQQWALP
jgi:eukaryotic-like serine/threonine-protein kinase